jgi:hypothetical protein
LQEAVVEREISQAITLCLFGERLHFILPLSPIPSTHIWLHMCWINTLHIIVVNKYVQYLFFLTNCFVQYYSFQSVRVLSISAISDRIGNKTDTVLLSWLFQCSHITAVNFARNNDGETLPPSSPLENKTLSITLYPSIPFIVKPWKGAYLLKGHWWILLMWISAKRKLFNCSIYHSM